MAVRSMTGWGTGHAPLGAGRVIVELRTVNSRSLDVRVRAAEALESASQLAEHRVRSRLRRGRVDVTLRAEGPVMPPPELDVERASTAIRSLEALRDRVAPSSEVPLSLLSLVPGLFAPPREEDVGALRQAVASATDAALDGVIASRLAEGRATTDDLAARAADNTAVAA